MWSMNVIVIIQYVWAMMGMHNYPQHEPRNRLICTLGEPGLQQALQRIAGLQLVLMSSGVRSNRFVCLLHRMGAIKLYSIVHLNQQRLLCFGCRPETWQEVCPSELEEDRQDTLEQLSSYLVSAATTMFEIFDVVSPTTLTCHAPARQ